MLRRHDCDVRIETSTRAFADPAIRDLNLIVPNYTMSVIEKAECANLTAAVQGGVGVGVASFHGGMCDAFRDSVDYQFMTGGQWVAHPGGIIDFRVNITRHDDPVMAGLADFDFRFEQYYMHVDPANQVLATTTFSREPGIWQMYIRQTRTNNKITGEGYFTFRLTAKLRPRFRTVICRTRPPMRSLRTKRKVKSPSPVILLLVRV